jgi:hypothetical protein
MKQHKGLNGSRGNEYRFDIKGCVITKQIVPKFRLGFKLLTRPKERLREFTRGTFLFVVAML